MTAGCLRRTRRQPRLAVIDTKTNKVATWVDLPGTGYGAAATPDGKWLLVAIPSTNEVAVVDLQAMKVARTIKVPARPQEVLDSTWRAPMAYVSCMGVGKVAAIDLDELGCGAGDRCGAWRDGLAWAK